MIDDIIQEATEAEEQGRDAGYAVGELLRIINQQKAKIRELKRELIDKQREIGKIAMKYFAREEEIERQKLEIDILIRKKEALRDDIAEKDAEIERYKKNNRFIDSECDSIMEKLAILDRQTLEAVASAKSEAYREFAERFKWYVTVAESKPTSRLSCSSLGIVNMIDLVYKELTESNE